MKFFGCDIIRRGPQEEHRVSLTFDDGPHPKFTPMILDVLERKSAPATFFNSGFNISRNRELTQEVAERGHQIGVHLYTHRNALLTGKKTLHTEIMRTKEMIEEITGTPCRYLRPPYGIITPALLSLCKNAGMSVVLWSLNTFDFMRKSYAVIIERVLKNGMRPGTIILFHECNFRDDSLDYSSTVKALEIVLDIMHSKGIKPVTIHELVENRPV